MKLKKYLAILPLACFGSQAIAEGETTAERNRDATFQFSTQVSRKVAKDLMQVELFSRKTGKNLAELKKAVSENLNPVLKLAKDQADIEVEASGVNNYANYTQKGKVDGWVAEGRLFLKSKNFESMAKVLESLGENVAIDQISFSVSPEKMRELEDDMTLDAIKQFEHKAQLIQKGMNAKGYHLKEVNLDTPRGQAPVYYAEARMSKMALSAAPNDEAMPLEAGTSEVSAHASGSIVIEQ